LRPASWNSGNGNFGETGKVKQPIRFDIFALNLTSVAALSEFRCESVAHPLIFRRALAKLKQMGAAMAKRVFLAILLVTLTGVASARVYEPPFRPEKVMVCPELDPSSVIGGLSLVAAGLAVWRGRKGKRTEDR
jgi:hypothetical protein